MLLLSIFAFLNGTEEEIFLESRLFPVLLDTFLNLSPGEATFVHFLT